MCNMPHIKGGQAPKKLRFSILKVPDGIYCCLQTYNLIGLMRRAETCQIYVFLSLSGEANKPDVGHDATKSVAC